jgi:phosphoglycerate dehydrogenase-like enzyme
MDQVKVLIFTRDAVNEKLLAMLRQVSPRLAIEAHTVKEAEKLGADVWRDVEVLFTTDPLPPEGATPNLRWIQGYYAGVDRWGQLPFTLPYIFTTTSGIHVHVVDARVRPETSAAIREPAEGGVACRPLHHLRAV